MIADWEIDGVFLTDLLEHRHPELFERLHAILTDHGTEVRLLHGVRDIWARDYCPIPVRSQQWIQFRYDPDYLRFDPDLRTGPEIGRQFRDLGECQQSDINLDGGNVVATRHTAIVTDKIYRENSDWDRSDLRAELRRLLQVERLIVVPKEPYDPIGHADGMVKFVDDETVVVNDYAQVDPGFGERLKNVLHGHELTVKSIPYYHDKHVRSGIPSAVGCYANFLRTKNVVFVPQFGHELDRDAWTKLAAEFPQGSVVSLDCTELAAEGGVLNCVSAGFQRFSESQSH